MQEFPDLTLVSPSRGFKGSAEQFQSLSIFFFPGEESSGFLHISKEMLIPQKV